MSTKDVFAAKAPHFFKLILPNGNLRIPRSFLRKYGDLSSTIYLKLPSGVEWEVGLTKHDGDVWFQNGWQEFSEYCSLDFGHLLVFRYEGNCRFYVLIFDTTAVEIDYPIYGTQCEDGNIDGEFQAPLEEINSDSSLEIIGDFQPCPKARAKSPSPCLRPHKRTKPNPSDKTDSTPNLQTSSQRFRHEGIYSEVPKLEKASKANEGGGGTRFTKKCPKSEVIEGLQQSSEEPGALRRASAFKSENPFFMVVMQPSYVHGSKLNIPYKFYKGYLNVKDDKIILLVYNRRTWSVKLTYRTKDKRRETRLTCGWKEFVLDNCLKVGDVCVFEFINGIEISFYVKIFRVAKDAKSCLSPANEGGDDGMCFTKRGPKSPSPCLRPHKRTKPNPSDKTDSTPNLQTSSQCFRHEGIHSEVPKLEKASKANEGCGGTCFTKRYPKIEVIEGLQQSSEEAAALRRASAFKSENPFFMVVMRPSYVCGKHNLHIPSRFSKSYLNVKDGNIILLVYNGRNWCVEFTTVANNRRREANFSHGWKEFILDNNVEVGDICVFEFIKGIEISFDVKIFRVAKDAKSYLSPANEGGDDGMCFTKRGPKSEVIKRKQQSSEEAGALRRASAFKSENPFFMVVMWPSYINNKRGLNIPKRFLKSYIKGSGKLMLQVKDKLWPMEVRYCQQFSSGFLSLTPWSTFARQNTLKIGDVCVFELIKRDDIVLKVCIFSRCG